MSETDNKEKNLIDATDSLEAITVIKCWKNGFFIAIIICLLSIEALFWLLNSGYVKTTDQPQKEAVVILEPQKAKPAAEPNIVIPNPIEKAAKLVTAEPNKITRKLTQGIKLPEFKLEKRQFEWLLQVFNFVLVPLSMLYCLTLLFMVKISLVARLGGLKHITRAFFLSLVAVVLLLPWQKYFGGIFVARCFPLQIYWNLLTYTRQAMPWVRLFIISAIVPIGLLSYVSSLPHKFAVVDGPRPCSSVWRLYNKWQSSLSLLSVWG